MTLHGERSSTVSKLKELQDLMIEILAIELRVVGEPPKGSVFTEATDLILDALDLAVDQVLCRMIEIRDQLLVMQCSDI